MCIRDRVYADADETLTFGEFCKRARARGEVAVGLQRAGESMPELNPSQGTKVHEGDQLVVLGDLLRVEARVVTLQYAL